MALIPAFNEAATIGGIVSEARAHVALVLVVDDGSRDSTASDAQRAGAEVIRYKENRGKGQALRAGFEAAREKGYGWVVTLDADGQHDPRDIPGFILTAREEQADMVIGHRLGDARSMPFRRRFGNLISTSLLSCLAGARLPDTQSGFRLIRRAVWEGSPPAADRFAAESEFVVLAARGGARIASRGIRTVYGGRPSHFHAIRDSLRFLCLCGRLAGRIGFGS
jgi:glycosyltransferase involved in cell wall biosynthesis